MLCLTRNLDTRDVNGGSNRAEVSRVIQDCQGEGLYVCTCLNVILKKVEKKTSVARCLLAERDVKRESLAQRRYTSLVLDFRSRRQGKDVCLTAWGFFVEGGVMSVRWLSWTLSEGKRVSKAKQSYIK